MPTTTLASLEALRSELANSKYYLNIRSGYMAPITLHCSYGDSGETITFYVFDGGQKLDLTGSTVSIHGTRRDGANFGPFACTVSDNAISFTLHSTMTAVEGGGIAEFTITKNSQTIGTCNFGILVENATFPNGVAYDSDPSVYQDILKYIQVISARIDNYIASGTAATDSELIDIRVKADGTIAASAGTAVREQIEELREFIESDVVFETLTDLVSGEYVGRDGVLIEYAGWSRSDYIKCYTADQVTVQMPRSGRWIGFYNKDKEPIKGNLIETTDAYTTDVPFGAYYFIVSESDEYVHRILIKNPKYSYYEKLYEDNIVTDLQPKVLNNFSLIYDVVQGEYVGTGGGFIEYAGWSRSDYIKCYTADQVTVQMPRSGRWIGFYNKDKEPIKGNLIETTDAYTTDVPFGAYYFIVSESDEYVHRILIKNPKYSYYEKLYEDNIVTDLQPKVLNNFSLIYDVVQGEYVGTGGGFIEYAGWSRSELIDCFGIRYLELNMPRDGRWVGFYDSNGDPLTSTLTSAGLNTIQVIDNAHYFAISEEDSRIKSISYRFSQTYVDDIRLNGTGVSNCATPARIRSINRLGLNTMANDRSYPEQSLVAYKAAVRAGFDVLLCDLSFTKDNIPVCFHDPTINRIARNSDGTTISETINVSSKTLAELNVYDYGIYAGSEFASTEILQLSDFLRFCKACGVEIYIEMKYCTMAQTKIAVDMVRRFGLSKNTSWSCHFRASNNQKFMCPWVITYDKTARVSLMTDGDGISGTTGFQDAVLNLKTGFNQVFVFNWASETVTEEEAAWLAENDIAYEAGYWDTAQGMINYYNRSVVKDIIVGMESNTLVAQDVLKEYALT